jgi:diguanylate cyclase
MRGGIVVPVHESADEDAGSFPEAGTAAGARPHARVQIRAERAAPMAAAWQAMQAGRLDAALALAESALARAETAREPDLLAAALTVQAHVLRLRSRLAAAHRMAQHAAAVYRDLRDHPGEAQALVQVAHAASSLGRTEEAVEAALLAVKLQEAQPTGVVQASAHNALGAAYFWSGAHDRARTAFETAIELAQRHGSASGVFQPLVNLMFCEAVKLATDRFHGGRLPPVDGLQALHARCRRALEANGAEGLAPGLAPIGRACYASLAALTACWSGAWREADARLLDAQHALAALEHDNWLHALACWVRAELAWARGDAAAAERELELMLQQANRAEHEQMAGLAHMSAAALLAQRGHSERALSHVRRLGLRQERVRAASLDSRDRVVDSQLDARQREQERERHLDDLRRHNLRYQRLAMEDALTGVANRRALDEALHQALSAAPGGHCCVALIDVDQFKRVNDSHSHLVGDQVLQRLAALLRGQVRGADLVARLGGDEFVVLLQTDEAAAAGVCERVRLAVLQFDWTALAPGLAIRVSIGLAQAHPGDDVESLLHRSDLAMYGCKWRSPPATGDVPTAVIAVPLTGADEPTVAA